MNIVLALPLLPRWPPEHPAPSQLETLAPHPVFFSSCPFVPSSQLVSFCGFLFLFAKSNVFLNQIMHDKQSSRFSLVPVLNKAAVCSLSCLQEGAPTQFCHYVIFIGSFL